MTYLPQDFPLKKCSKQFRPLKNARHLSFFSTFHITFPVPIKNSGRTERRIIMEGKSLTKHRFIPAIQIDGDQSAQNWKVPHEYSNNLVKIHDNMK